MLIVKIELLKVHFKLLCNLTQNRLNQMEFAYKAQLRYPSQGYLRYKDFRSNIAPSYVEARIVP